MKKILLGASVVALALLPYTGFGDESVSLEELKQFSVTFTGEPLRDVLAEVNQKSGYRVRLGKELGSVKVSGKFNQVTINEFFKRVLKGKNVVLEFSDERKTLSVQTFAMASGSVEYEGKQVAGAEIHNQNVMDNSFAALHAQQLDSFNQWKSDPNAIDPMTGIRKGDLNEIQQEQLAAFKKKQEDPTTIDPMTGLAKGVLQKTQQEQLASFSQYENDENAVDAMTGLPRKQLKELQQRQLASFVQRQSDPDAVDPMTGLQRGEMKKMQEKQLAAFAARHKK